MKKIKRITAVALVAIFMAISVMPIFAVKAAPATYSTESNSGTRDEVCVSLDGTSASSYYTGDYTYGNLSSLSSSQLRSKLNSLMESTHKKTSSYPDCKTKATSTDCENNNGKVTLIYLSYQATYSQFSGNAGGWNREHVWPKSLGGYGNDGPGADLHHLRPSDASVNSTRGNKKYGNVGSGSNAYGSISGTTSTVGGTYSSDYFEPNDNVKGDVARICLYMYVRYGYDYSMCSSITNVFQSVDVLLEWCELDPVDTWEMGRNEVVGAYQGNRNVFIDYPEYAWLLFDEEVPSTMKTPSGRASGNPTDGGDNSGGTSGGDNNGGTSGGDNNGGSSGGNDTNQPTVDPAICEHLNIELHGVCEATCDGDGYSGDRICADCNTVIEKGSIIPKMGEHNFEPFNSEYEYCTGCGAVQRISGSAVEESGGISGAWIAVGAAAAIAVVIVVVAVVGTLGVAVVGLGVGVGAGVLIVVIIKKKK